MGDAGRIAVFALTLLAAVASVIYLITAVSGDEQAQPEATATQTAGGSAPGAGLQKSADEQSPEQQAMAAAGGFVTALQSISHTDDKPSAWVDRIGEHTTAGYRDELSAGVDPGAVTPRYARVKAEGVDVQVRIISVTGFRGDADEQKLTVVFDEVESGSGPVVTTRQSMPVLLSVEDGLWKVSGSSAPAEVDDAR